MITRITTADLDLRIVNKYISSYSMRRSGGSCMLSICMNGDIDGICVTNPMFNGAPMVMADMDHIMLHDGVMAHIYQ
jgi:hypothetical protein